MGLKINLLASKKQKKRHVTRRGRGRAVLNVSILLIVLLLLSASGVYAYHYLLTKEVEVLDRDIADQKAVIASYKDVEGRKSVIVAKTNEIQRIYNEKFDYLKAIEDAQQVFGFSIAIESISIEKNGVVNVEARKVSDITLSQEQAFATNIAEMNLTVLVPTSAELEDTIDTLLGFEGQGLSSVIVTSTTLTEEGEYAVVFSITFASNTPTVPVSADVTPVQ
ncbi:MAG: hypothetical protein NUV98_03900 [Candidatus Roizmanbacteria bacterium]|nr:hypothetical protein [Candidatus Roizmanbacteria bacterium]